MEAERLDVGELVRVSLDPHGNAMEDFEAFEADYEGLHRVKQAWLDSDRPVEAQELSDSIRQLEEANPGFTAYYEARQDFLDVIEYFNNAIQTYTGTPTFKNQMQEALDVYIDENQQFAHLVWTN